MTQPRSLIWPAFVVALAMVMSLAPAASAKRPRKLKTPVAKVHAMDDGIQLVHVPMPGHGAVSLRFLVRSGGNDDPSEKDGLAHVLEHVLFHGTYDLPEGKLFEDARAIGATINAITTPEWTAYTLDARAETFMPMASSYLKTITNPALPFAELEREKAVVLAEQEVRSAHSILWGCDQLLFPSDNQGRTLIGSEKTRAAIQPEDLMRFFSAHYVTQNIIAVVVGDITLGDAKALLTTSVLLPPGPKKTLPVDPAPPNVGSEAKSLSWTTATAVGYLVDRNVDDVTCHAAARLVDYHVYKAVRLDDTVAQQASAFCHRTRRERFLVAVAFGTNSLASQLPDLLDKAFKQATQKASSSEKKILTQRAAAERDLTLSSTGALADALIFSFGNPGGELKRDLNLVLKPTSFNAPKVQKLLKKTVKKKRRFVVHLSPFQG